MPKKSAARGTSQRTKARGQKSFELVRQDSDGNTIEEQISAEETTATQNAEKAVAVAVSPSSEPKAVQEPQKKEKSVSNAPRAAQAPSAPAPAAVPETPRAGSAAARLAARRQATQRVQQRNAASLITPEHFAYVRKDLITIAILASVMFAAIIILYFFFGSIL